jgi:hypothetical protein
MGDGNMSSKTTQETKSNKKGNPDIQAEFEALPLDEKLSSLFKMEVAALTEAFNYVSKNPWKVVEKVGDMITDLGTRIENEVKRASGYTPPSAANGSGEKKANGPTNNAPTNAG